MKEPLFIIIAWLINGGIKFVTGEHAPNNRPIIGILSQEVEDTQYPKDKYRSYIVASYVKAVQAAGGRVVPLMIGRNRDYYKSLMRKINGVIFPGGNIFFNTTGGYADAGQYIYEYAKELNDAGDHFPILGVCLGIQFFVILDSGRESNNLVPCSSHSSIPLKLIKDYRHTKLMSGLDDESSELLQHHNVTVNCHNYCITDKNLDRYNLTHDWQPTSYSVDENGLKFIASMEHKRYPFFGLQFHPEKSAYEWMPSKKYAHIESAIKVNRYFYDVFLRESRNSTHTFSNEKEENLFSIYNYNPFFTGSHNNAGLYHAFDQCYFFEPLLNSDEDREN